MIREEEAYYENYTEGVTIRCPICNTQKRLRIPFNVIKQSLQLTTISIPPGLICNDSFQAFVDKNFKIRGYQKVDFDFSTIEFYEKPLNESRQESNIYYFRDLPISNKIIELLRNFVDSNNVLGTAFFTIEGQIIYSSLSLKTLYHTIREFETRNEKHLLMIKKIFLFLENNQKIFSQFIKISGFSLIITLLFSKTVQLGMGDFYLKDLIKKIERLKNK